VTQDFYLAAGPSTPILGAGEAYLALELFLAQFITRGDLSVSTLRRWVHMEPDGKSNDPAQWSDWLDCVHAVKGEEVDPASDTFGVLGQSIIHRSTT
jgi:hypothetical protein